MRQILLKNILQKNKKNRIMKTFQNKKKTLKMKSSLKRKISLKMKYQKMINQKKNPNVLPKISSSTIFTAASSNFLAQFTFTSPSFIRMASMILMSVSRIHVMTTTT